MVKISKYIIAVLFIIFLTADLKSQVSQSWSTRYNGLLDSIDIARDVAVDNNGNVYITGYSWGIGTFTDIVTIKYNSSGIQQWVVRYNGEGGLFDEGYSIALDNSGFVYITGFSYGISSSSDIITIKYDNNGVQQWAKRYNGPGNSDDAAYAIVIDNSGNVIVTGYSRSGFIAGTEDYTTIKYFPNGIEQWVQMYNGIGNNQDKAYAIVVDNSDNVIITGESRGGSISGSEDYATVKYGSGGVQQWAARYNGPGNNSDKAYAIVVDNSDNVFVTGESMSTNVSGSEDYATVKYGSGGVQQWAARYNGTGNNTDKAYAIVVDNSDNVVVTGESRNSSIIGSEDYTTIKYNNSGTQQWAARYNGPGSSEDKAYAIVVDNGDNVYVTGYSRTTSVQGSEDYTTLKYNTSGGQVWEARYNGSGFNEDKAYAIVVDNSDNVYVTGSSRHDIFYGTEDYTTVKYSQPNGITLISDKQPKFFMLYQNYPNPFNPDTKIKFDIVRRSHVDIIIYDVLGKNVGLLLSTALNPGSYQYTFNGAELPSGIYFCIMNKIETLYFLQQGYIFKIYFLFK